MRKSHWLSLAVVSLLGFSGCHSDDNIQTDNKPVPAVKSVAVSPVAKADPTRVWPDISADIGGNDPIEGFNRSMAAVNYVGFRWVFRPIGGLWCSIFPRHVIGCFNRFCDNVAFPRPLFSCALQGKFEGSGIVFTRFLTNTTLGIAGFYDPAWSWFGLERRNEDFGQAFAVWGIGPGCFITLPVEGPVTIRDGVGLIFDYAVDPKSYFYGGQWFAKINKGAYFYRDMDIVSRSYADPYEFIKEYYYQQRYVLINDLDRRAAAVWRGEGELSPSVKASLKASVSPAAPAGLSVVDIAGARRRGGEIETLLVGKVMPKRDQESMWTDLSLWNTDFFYQGSVRSIRFYPDRPAMDYKVWLQERKDAPLAVVLPGTGAFYTNTVVTALAELLFDQGYAVAVINGAMNWQFMESTSSAQAPGFTPVDAADTRRAIIGVIDDLEKNKERTFPRRIVTGISMGGMHALFIAAMEKKEPKIKADRYLAINPPVTLLHAVRQIDKCMTSWRNWPSDQVFGKGSYAVEKFSDMTRIPTSPFVAPKPVEAPKKDVAKKDVAKDEKKEKPPLPGDYLPFDQTEAGFLIGLAFRMTLDEIMLTIHHRYDPGILKTPYSWGNRTALYREIREYDFERYVATFLVKYYSAREKRAVTVEELSRRASLQAIAPELKDDDRVRIIHTADDFLESDADRLWMAETFKGRCVFFATGGHVGDMFYQQVQDRIVEWTRLPSAAKAAAVHKK